MDIVCQYEAGERIDWATLIMANLAAQLDAIKVVDRGRLSYSTLL